MGRIKKVATERHTATLSPFVRDFVVETTKVSLVQLPALLDTFPQHWPLPRGDLYHWIPLLDRFDHVLELFNKEYGLNEGPQTQPFERRLLQKGDAEESLPYPAVNTAAKDLDEAGFSAEGDRELIQSVLHFTRILLEHCGNRSLYASSTHINDILHTTSLSLLRLCLKLSLRLAQRYQVARHKVHNPGAQAVLLANHYNINLENLHKIACPFPKPSSQGPSLTHTPGKGKEKMAQTTAFNPSDLVYIAKDNIPPVLQHDLSTVTLSYYEHPAAPFSSPSSAAYLAPEAPPATPTPTRRTSNLGPARDHASSGERSILPEDAPSSPVKSREVDTTPVNSAKLFQIPAEKVCQSPAWSLVKDALPGLPNEVRYELLNRVRIARAFSSTQMTSQDLLEVRLLAIANLAYALTESKFQEKVGTADAEEPKMYHLAQQLCDLLQPATSGQRALSAQCETTVIIALEALTKTKSKSSEVADALVINVNHGILYYELRKVIASLRLGEHSDKSVELQENDWRDATFDLINSLLLSNAQARYGEKMVAAGIMAVLLEALSLRTSRSERFHERILQFFDSFIHGIPTAFQTLANIKGLDVIADLTAFEVNTALENARTGNGLPQAFKSKVVDYSISFYQQATLRQLFKNTVHMFEHNAGAHDRLLRNLIDTPQVLDALRSVIEGATTFGSNVWSGAVNIISNFIHTEPTSYQVIGEAGLSKSLLESITGDKIPHELPSLGEILPAADTPRIEAGPDGEPTYPSAAGILPVGEVMCDIPTVFGAICLNESGMQLFQASSALVKYLNIFLSPAHVRAMEEEGHTATTIGHAFDELSRHHPRLKDQLMAAVLNMLRRLRELTAILAQQHQTGAKLWEVQDGKLAIAGGQNALRGSAAADHEENLSGTPAFDTNSEDEHDRAPAVPYLSACFKFLEGFFHNGSMCALFCEESGAELLLDLAMAPSNPYDLVAFPLFTKISQVLKSMCEARPPLVLPSIIKRTQQTMLGLNDLLNCDNTSSSFGKYTELPERDSSPFAKGSDGTTVVKSLLNIHLLTHVLGRTLAPPPYTLRHSNQSNNTFTNLVFTDVYVELVRSLSKLHSACLWENLLLQHGMSDDAKSKTEPQPFVMRRIDANGVVEISADRGDARRPIGIEQTSAALQSSDHSRREMLALKNSRAIRYLLSQVPMGIESFFHSLGQAIAAKRSDTMSPIAKQHASFVAECLAQAMIWELDFRRNQPDQKNMETRYLGQVLSMISRMLLRNSYSVEAFGTKEALTLVMLKFYRAGGFAKLNQYLARFVEMLVEQDEHDKVPLKHIIQSILSFYGQIVRPKCINEASQSINISTRTMPDSPEYFNSAQFLVEIRDAIVPAISAIWHSNHIEKFSDANMKSIVDVLRHILKAEGEAGALIRRGSQGRRVPTQEPEVKLVNDSNVTRVRDAGFDTTLSREALYRCNDNPQNAEAYCRLRQTDPRVPRFPIDDEGSAADSQAQTSTEISGDAGSVQMEDVRTLDLDHDQDMVLDADSAEQMDGSRERTHVRPQSPPATDQLQPIISLEDLEDKRQALREDLIDRCLEVLSTQPSITFELSDLIQAAVPKGREGDGPRAEIGTTLVSSLASLQGEEGSTESGLKIHAYAHLVALIIQEGAFFDKTLNDLKEHFELLVSWVQLGPKQSVEEAPWIEMVLLIIERVLAEDEQPMEVDWHPPSMEDPLKPLPVPTVPDPVVAPELRSQLFDALVNLLPKIGKNSSLGLSVCRVMVVLTRRREIATRLTAKHTLGRLFLMVRQLAGSLDEKLQSSFMLILRHMIEDEETVRQIMRAEIRVVFDGSHRAPRAMDTTSYTRNLHHLAIRMPQIFVEVTQEMLEIARYDGNPSRAQSLALKKASPLEAKVEDGSAAQNSTEAEGTVVQKPAELRAPTVESTDGVVQFLLRELSNYRDVDDNPPQPAKDGFKERLTANAATPDVEMNDAATPSAADGTPAATAVPEAKNSRPPFNPDEHTIYIYRCFILQCLAELVACYNKTKVEFINFSRKSDAQPVTPTKPRAGTLNYLMGTLLPVGTLEHRDDATYRKKVATANWATNVLVSLCTKTQERQPNLSAHSFESVDFVELEPELTFVRKFVLEHALRSFKEATSSLEPLDQSYSRLLALSDLFNRMLNSKIDLQRSDVVAIGSYSAHQQIGRLMYEKNFISTLTSAIAELDLKFPNAKRCVKYILGPLKQLTEIGITLSQTGDLSSSTGLETTTDEDDISSATSISDDEVRREQTPDLLRNTSLNNDNEDDEDASDDDSDDDDDEMEFEDGYGEEMEYEEEAAADHGDVVSDEDEELDDMGEEEGMSGDVDMEIDVLMEGEDEEDSDDEEELDDDDEDDDHAADFHQHLEEITGDDDNASLAGGEGGDWGDDDDMGFEGEDDDIGGGPLDHMTRILAGAADPSDPDDHDGIVRIDMGNGPEEFFEDEQAAEDDDDEEDGEEYHEDVVFEPEGEDDEDDDQDGGWAWDIPEPSGILRGGHQHHQHHHHHPRPLNDVFTMMGESLRPNFRTHRSTPNARDEDGVNPLLQRDSGTSNQVRDRDTAEAFGPRYTARRTYLAHQGEALLQDLVANVDPYGPNVINVNVEAGGGLPSMAAIPPIFTVAGRHGGRAVLNVDPSRPWREQLAAPPHWPYAMAGARMNERTHVGNEEAQAVEFRPRQTSNRWQEEARMLFPGKFHDKAIRVINAIVRALVPAAMEARRLREKEEAERRAAAEKEAEEVRKQAEAEKAEREAKEKKEQEERELAERAEAEARVLEEAGQSGQTEDENPDGEMEDIQQEQQTATPDGLAESTQTTETPVAERITITIRGSELDITSLGIDREYIEALPEDIREEVIMQQFAEQRTQQAQTGEAPSEISREFLEALPRDIQQELIRSEQLDRRRRERDEERRRRQQEGHPAAVAAQPEEMNNADFMAMLEPTLRQAVLMEADENVLAALPEDIQAEARALFGNRRPRADNIARSLEAARARVLDGTGAAGHDDEAPHEASVQRRPVAQMLDKPGIATLLRLMFVSLNSKAKNNLHGILSDVCKNTQNRAEVISILLNILQDGTVDVGAVERSFALLSLRAKQPAGLKTPQPAKTPSPSQQDVTTSTELSPLNIVQQCLGTLNALATDNPRVPSFFLLEHETVASQKAKADKKGKGRETKAAKFPLNALLTLLDRKLISENTAVMETLASLLKTVTQPLTIVLRRQKDALDAEKADAEQAALAQDQDDAEPATAQMQTREAPAETIAAEGTTSAPEASSGPSKELSEEKPEAKRKRKELTPPDVPEENIALVVNILAARECPNKTFTDTLDIIKNLSAIPGAKEVFGKELIRQAQELGQTLLEDLEDLAKQIHAAQSGTDLQGMALASFSSAGSKQRKLLRVLVALDHLFDPKRTPQGLTSTDDGSEQKLKDGILATLYNSATFEKLWHSLSVCLTAIRERGGMVNVATILLPLIESLMVVCRNNTPQQVDGTVSSPVDTTVSPLAPPDSRMENLFFSFTEEHRKVLNELIRNNAKLMNGNLSVLAKNSKVLEFDNKRSYFSRKLHDRRSEVRVAHPALQLSIRRDQVFLDSFKSLYYKTGNEIKYGKLNIRFHGEEGIDAGGVSREWFAAMARQMFNPDYALFNPVAADRTTFHPNSLSAVNPEHLMFFKFIGRIIGKALYENRVLDCHFSRAVYRKILGKSVSLKDMESLDLEYYKSLVWILENDITDVTFDTFSVEVDTFGVIDTVDLVPNGRNISVTEENKHEFVRHVVEYRLIKSVQQQLDHFLEGFHEIIPAELVAIFNEQELELLISGLPDIDVDDWKNNTDYTNYQPTSPQIQWFWRAVRSFDKEEKAKLLQFVTGTSKVPLNGFKELEGMNGFSKFNIHRDFSSKEKLPSSHTCFNQLDLPEYESYENLRQQMYTAITAGSEYFGFA